MGVILYQVFNGVSFKFCRAQSHAVNRILLFHFSEELVGVKLVVFVEAVVRWVVVIEGLGAVSKSSHGWIILICHALLHVNVTELFFLFFLLDNPHFFLKFMLFLFIFNFCKFHFFANLLLVLFLLILAHIILI